MSTELQALFLIATAVECILLCPRSRLPSENMISSIGDSSNQTLERTADRPENPFSMRSTLESETQLALVSGRSACSR